MKIIAKIIGKVGIMASKGTLASFWFAYEPDLPNEKNSDSN
ncbi:AgrD family cyclic lactone autoinducer peptide [Alkalihalobacillus sp. NPDC078783]